MVVRAQKANGVARMPWYERPLQLVPAGVFGKLSCSPNFLRDDLSLGPDGSRPSAGLESMAETAAGLEHAAGTVEFIAKLTKSLTVLVIR